MPDTPYTQAELANVTAQSPERGPVCSRCGVHVPEFADLSREDRRRIYELIHEKPSRAVKELRTATGCPDSWARIWVEHFGLPKSKSQVLFCNSPSRTTGKGYDLELILALRPSDAVYDLGGALELAGGLDTPGALNQVETTFLRVFSCHNFIVGDGLSGWLWHYAHPDFLRSTCEAFRAIGAPRTADTLWRVASIFPQSVLPDNARQYERAVQSEEHAELFGELADEMDKLDEETEGVEAALHAYVLAHTQDFR